MRRTLLLLLLILQAVVASNASAQSLTTESKTAPSGTRYLLIHQNGTNCDWVVQRPSRNDRCILLCVPAAFTDTFAFTKSIHGFAVEHGKVVQDKVDSSIGGALQILSGDCSIVAPDYKKSQIWREPIIRAGGSFFQQFQVVRDGKAEKFKDKSLFQRRGYFINGKDRGVIESDRAITLSQFAEDAASFHFNSVLYFDMGLWDEGWYRDSKTGTVVTIGQDRSRTSDQTNWLIFRSKDK